MRLIETLLQYLRERQTPVVRFLHMTVLLMVLSQLVSSNFIGFSDDGAISKKFIEYYGTWVHIITGAVLLAIVLIFVFTVFRTHGIRYFFPYIFNDFKQLKEDVVLMKQLKLPEANPSGIAAVVQGLGLSALLLVLISGLTWFILWNYGVTWSEVLKEAHELLTGLVITYVVGHGAMGILHVYFIQPKNN